MKKIITTNIFAGVLALSSANAASIVAGFDQRFIGANFDAATGVLPDEVSASQNATAQMDGTPGGTFSFTTTPNGATALQNSDANGDSGTRLQFNRDVALGGTSGFTIQAVFSGNSTPDSTNTATGLVGFGETAGFSGLFLGAEPNGAVGIRGGNVNGTGNGPGFLDVEGIQNNAAVDQFAIYTLVVDPTAANVFSATIVDPLTGATLLSATLPNPGPDVNGITSIDGIGTLGGLFAGEVGGGPNGNGNFDSQDNFNGAIADIVFYNSVLTDAELDQNVDFFTETFFVVPEPSSSMLVLLGAVAFCGRRVRKA